MKDANRNPVLEPEDKQEYERRYLAAWRRPGPCVVTHSPDGEPRVRRDTVDVYGEYPDTQLVVSYSWPDKHPGAVLVVTQRIWCPELLDNPERWANWGTVSAMEAHDTDYLNLWRDGETVFHPRPPSGSKRPD